MPFLSIVRSAALVKRSVIQRFSLSTQNRAPLQVGQEAALGLVVRVRNVVAHHRGLAGDLTDSSHGSLLRNAGDAPPLRRTQRAGHTWRTRQSPVSIPRESGLAIQVLRLTVTATQ